MVTSHSGTGRMVMDNPVIPCEDHGMTNHGNARNIAVGPNDGTWIPGAGYANGRTVAHMVATAMIAMVNHG